MMRFFEPNLTLFFTSNFVRFALYGFSSQVSSQAKPCCQLRRLEAN
jgi:hypothetical protein